MKNSKSKMHGNNSDEFGLLARRLEEEWRASLPRLTIRDWLEIFPEAKEVYTLKIKEREERKDKITDIVRKKLKIIKRSKMPWFWKIWIALNEGQELLNIDKQLARLRFEQQIARGQAPRSSKSVSQEQIESARRADITIILQNAGVKLYRSGHNWRGLCIFHNEKTPSLYVYTRDNRYHCFGCSKDGDSIQLIMDLHGLRFVDAVKSLI